jgi:hypothetical protein
MLILPVCGALNMLLCEKMFYQEQALLYLFVGALLHGAANFKLILPSPQQRVNILLYQQLQEKYCLSGIF